MNLVDSSGWLECFANGRNTGFFAPAVEDPSRLLVPTVSLFEVFKRVRQQRREPSALQAVALMHQGRVVELDATLALAAARLSVQERLPLADSVMPPPPAPSTRRCGRRIPTSRGAMASALSRPERARRADFDIGSAGSPPTSSTSCHGRGTER